MLVLTKYAKEFSKTAHVQCKTKSKFAQYTSESRRWNHIIIHENAREIQVPLPYGHMAGKEWGNVDKGYPILCLHAFSDNCGSFDPIGPLLSDRFHYIALDAYGHGRTSHAPPGTTFNYWDLVIFVKRAINHFKIEKFSILGHSMGGSTGFLVASLYPKMVDRLLTLDICKPVGVPLLRHTQNKTEAIEILLDLERKSANPKSQKSYKLDELVNRFVESMNGTITSEAVRILLKRGAKPSGNGFIFSHDPRMMVATVMRFGLEEQRQVLKDLKCHLKIVKAKQGPLYEPAEWQEEFIAIYKRQCASYEYDESVDGTHHFHMHHPERVAPIINEYFGRL